MANLFDRYHWNPIHQGYNPNSVKPKVINVPVQFIGTEERNSKLSPGTPKAAALVVPSEEARVYAATTIQRIVRGFLIRKNARIVRQVAAEVDEIEQNLKENEAKICLDARERLRVNEALMVLLLRLDSVRGATRDLRKKVVRRIIALQETIDSVSTSADDRNDSSNEAADESAVDNERAEDPTRDPEEETNGAEIDLGTKIPTVVESSDRQNVLIADDLKDSMVETADKSSTDHEDQEVCEEIPFQLPCSMSELLLEEKVEEGIGMRKLIENLAAENGRLKEIVEQLCATSAEQCRLMEGFAGRVENLERFVHRMDRRRKRRGPACSAIFSAK